ncbi:MAG: LysR family transcriptional regulator [Phascolarctobacterium sp.]|nr:LysR family transcriptional regulator [Phascolarctobacterium sp.]
MNISRFDYFISLARERSFTKAAKQLHITQQTLSNYIAQLEKEIGSSLFVRSIPLKLTYAGQVYLRYALTIQSQLESMQHELDDIAQKERGLLKIGIAFSRGHILMPKLITSFQRQHPFIQVQLVEASNEVLRNKLLSHEIDLAIANFEEAVPGMELQDFYEEENVLFVSDELLEKIYGTDRERVLQEVIELGNLRPLKDCPFVLMNIDNIAGRIGRRFLAEAGCEMDIKVQSDNIETLLSLCVEGCGACFCPENLALKTLSRETLAKLHLLRLGAGAKYMIRFGYVKQNYQWRSIALFIEEALALYK